MTDHEAANAHESGDCPPGCPHPDHQYDSPWTEEEICLISLSSGSDHEYDSIGPVTL